MNNSNQHNNNAATKSRSNITGRLIFSKMYNHEKEAQLLLGKHKPTQQERFEISLKSIDCGFLKPLANNSEAEWITDIDKLMLSRIAKVELERIQEPHRTIFILFANNYTQKEIAKRMHRGQSAVSQSIKRTRRKLLKILNR